MGALIIVLFMLLMLVLGMGNKYNSYAVTLAGTILAAVICVGMFWIILNGGF